MKTGKVRVQSKSLMKELLNFVVLIGIAALPMALGKLGLGNAAGFAFTAAVVMVAGVYLILSPVRYVSFCLWLWVLTPITRRVYDYTFGYTCLLYTSDAADE